MPKLRQKYKKPLGEINQAGAPNVLQTNRAASTSNEGNNRAATGEDLGGVSHLLDKENECWPGTSTASGASDLYHELDSFRQRWRRELEVTTPKSHLNETGPTAEVNQAPVIKSDESRFCDKTISYGNELESVGVEKKLNAEEDSTYAEAKRLFLIAVDLERDDKHCESIRYYKKSMHLCPDIEKQIFREHCEASIKDLAANRASQANEHESQDSQSGDNQEHSDVSLYERILERHQEDSDNHNYSHCRPQHKVKPIGSLHISDLPQELLSKIFRHLVGHELDLASLEQAGLVCRGFYLTSRDKLLWRDICFSTWGASTLEAAPKGGSSIDWRRMFLERPRVNFDGVYISRTRYLRFFPDRRVLILTTNEEPEKIVPIFRHALNAKQFSPELSIMEGKYEFSTGNQICITAEKKCRVLPPNQSNRRQAQFNWSQQTPIRQNFHLKFELKTVPTKPYKNNVLRWLKYTIISHLETGQEVTNFDLSPDTFPNLAFSRVKRFNLRSAMPLSHH